MSAVGRGSGEGNRDEGRGGGWGGRGGRAGGVAVGPTELCEVVGSGPLKPQPWRSRGPVAAGGARWRPVAAHGARRCPVAADGPRWREVARLRRPQRRVALSIHSRDALM